MRSVRRAGAFASGVLLYCAVIGASATLSEFGLPQAIQTWLGGRTSVTAVVTEALLIALLMLLLTLCWTYLTIRPAGALRRGQRPTTPWCLGGIACGWLGWMLFGAMHFALNANAYSQPLLNLLLSSTAPPLWGCLNIVGVAAGAMLAGALASRARQAQRALYGQRVSAQPTSLRSA